MDKKIKILTEAGSTIGFGHLTRCCALYDAAIEAGRNCELIIFTDNDNGLGMISQHNIRKYRVVDWKDIDFIKRNISKKDNCIIDSYLANYDIYELITEKANKAMYIDDNARIQYPIKGIIVNPSFYFDTSTYGKNVSYAGVEYVILRDEFKKMEKINVKNEVCEILVTLGGADIKNLTQKIVEVINDVYYDVITNVVVTSAFASFNDIPLVETEKVKIYKDIDAKKMKELMLASDFAVTAAGQTIYELIATCTPFIPIRAANNQSNNIRGLLEISKDIFILQYNYDFSDSLRKELEKHKSKDYRLNITSLFNNVIDGMGSCRIINKLLKKAEYMK